MRIEIRPHADGGDGGDSLPGQPWQPPQEPPSPDGGSPEGDGKHRK
ncbi:hypothetical protein K7472_18945 [Streptomyces sp. PTM05]|uniref:Uncharacterized protein n=1 Tax=Streptantibioticus parmotrematis TaxID=2873249 RepID=A0ABS7QYQ4_9ACTN|nr:hypothetical protein [Streptantibioticus parmotrematis]MBY8886919.1 hypothetical protein [Streptantibioticus parmotrematis]